MAINRSHWLKQLKRIRIFRWGEDTRFCQFGGSYLACSGGTVPDCSGIAPGCAQRTISSAGNQTEVHHMQGKHLIPYLWFFFFKCVVMHRCLHGITNIIGLLDLLNLSQRQNIQDHELNNWNLTTRDSSWDSWNSLKVIEFYISSRKLLP